MHGVRFTVEGKRIVNRFFAPFLNRGGSRMSSSGNLLTPSIRPAGPGKKRMTSAVGRSLSRVQSNYSWTNLPINYI